MNPLPDSVLGVDQSLSSTGLASVDLRDGTIRTMAVRPTLRGHARRRFIVRKVLAVAQTHDLVGIEGPAFSRNGRGHSEIQGLFWMLRTALWEAGIPVAEISPGTRAKYATGKGGGPDAAKPRVHAATRGLWPQLKLATSDEADAVLLAAIAARVAGRPFDPQPPAERFAPVNGIRISVD